MSAYFMSTFSSALLMLAGLLSSPVARLPEQAIEGERGNVQIVHTPTREELMIDVIVGQPHRLYFNEKPFRIQIANEVILECSLINWDPRELSLEGKKDGSTIFNIWFGDRNDPATHHLISYHVNVLSEGSLKLRLKRACEALETEINRGFPQDAVCLVLVDEKLVVCGQVKDSDTAAKILKIVRAHLPVPAAMTSDPSSEEMRDLKVVDVLRVASELGQENKEQRGDPKGSGMRVARIINPWARLKELLASLVPQPSEAVRTILRTLPLREITDAMTVRPSPDCLASLYVANGSLGASGDAVNSADQSRILEVIRANLDAFTRRKEERIQQNKVECVNLLRVPGEQQVMLKVMVAAVRKPSLQQLGLDSKAPVNATVDVLARDHGNPESSPATPCIKLPARIENGASVRTIWNLSRAQQADIVTEQNQIGVPGGLVTCRAASRVGHSPYGLPDDDLGSRGFPDLRFPSCGFPISFILGISSSIVEENRLRLELNADVVLRDSVANTGEALVGGPNVRTINATVEIHSGQTIVIANLLPADADGNVERVPAGSDPSAARALFDLKQTDDDDWQLVLLVTAEAVHPMGPQVPGESSTGKQPRRKTRLTEDTLVSDYDTRDEELARYPVFGSCGSLYR